MINSRRCRFIAAQFSFGCTPTLTKGTPSPEVTVSICEFLKLGSLKRLRIFSSPTESVYGTNYDFAPYAAFLGSLGSPTSCSEGTRHHLSALGTPFSRMLPAYGFILRQPTRSLVALLRPCLCNNAHRRYWNINQFAIAYALRPQLRFRLTLEGLTWSRKPWVYGERVSHSFYRYSSWHNLSSALQASFRSLFAARTMLPYRTYA